MHKEFNDTGICIPTQHYMADTSEKIDKIFALMEKGKYFVINRPRQYGKTTTLYLLEQRLLREQNYLPVFISFEGIGTDSYKNEQWFIEAFVAELEDVFSRLYNKDFSHNPSLVSTFISLFEKTPGAKLSEIFKQGRRLLRLTDLERWLTVLVQAVERPIVLMIDEVDKSSNHTLFLNFLALLRNKYLAAKQGRDATFYSVILAGVHDIKTLKLKIRPEDDRKYNSPWNIAIDFTVDMNLTPQEIGTMLADYIQETGTRMNQPDIAERLFYFTSGYPFLVSKLCKLIDEEIQPEEEWRSEHVDEAVNRLLFLRNTNFDSLFVNLENNADLYALVENILLEEEQIVYNEYSHAIHLGLLYGIFVREQGVVDIHNRIYKEQIYNYMTVNLRLQALSDSRLRDYQFQGTYLLPDGSLNMEMVLLKFQEFMKTEYSRRDQTFLERNGRLIFLAFLKPIINGQGYDFKEPQISEEKRLDIAVVFRTQKSVIELKIWRGEAAHQRGLRQLCDYLELTGQKTGYLIIFDFTQEGQKTWKHETFQIEDKEIFAIWV